MDELDDALDRDDERRAWSQRQSKERAGLGDEWTDRFGLGPSTPRYRY